MTQERTRELLASARLHLVGAQGQLAQARKAKAFKGDAQWTWAVNEAHRVSLEVAAALLGEVGVQATWEWETDKESQPNQALAKAWREHFAAASEFASFVNLPVEAVRYIQDHRSVEQFDQPQAEARATQAERFLAQAERYLSTRCVGLGSIA